MATINSFPPRKPPLASEPEMIQLMEDDLKSKLLAVLTKAQMYQIPVMGVFSIDDLEAHKAQDICNNGAAMGVMYAGCNAMDRSQTELNRDRRTNAAQGQEYLFGVVLGVPAQGDMCGGRTPATTILSLARQAILGTSLEAYSETRTWVFVRENPEYAASTNEVLYYLQLWRLTLIGQGNQ